FMNFKKLLKIAPEIYDAYYGVGLFHFWKGYMAKSLNWLSAAEGEIDKGIELIKVSINKGKYTPIEAESSLLRVYYLLERYDESLEICKKILIKYPEFLFCKWHLIKSLVGLKEWKRVLKECDKFEKFFQTNADPGELAFVEINHYRCVAYYHLGEKDKALKIGEEIVDDENEYTSLQIFKDIKKTTKKLLKDIL
ncbi:MAG: hypothetical protein KAS39_01150, partial [Actinomycetia bacterium]|nr:hypothetical protein [Actinomycetes bacterium]